MHLHFGSHGGPALEVLVGGQAGSSDCGLPGELLCARGKNLGNLKADLLLMLPISRMWQ